MLEYFIKEETYIRQQPGFKSPKFPYYIYKLSKALYALMKSPRVWYDMFKSFLLKNGFEMDEVDKT